jgi:hypothetical protein
MPQVCRQAFAVGDQPVVLGVSPGQFELRQQAPVGEEEGPGAMLGIVLYCAADEVVTMPAVLRTLLRCSAASACPGFAPCWPSRKGLQRQVFEHQISLPAAHAVPDYPWHAQCGTSGQRAQAIGLGGEHPGQFGVVQFDEVALPALATISAREIEPPVISVSESMFAGEPVPTLMASHSAAASGASSCSWPGLMTLLAA